VRDAPEDLLGALGLSAALGMRRRQGLGAIYRRLKV
jgi:sulfur transfer protein SufE